MTDDATLVQNLAADPAASTWLSANAGSGKTRVLTNRVARLLLNGVEPQNILCLTYTKAAASEMQNRLFQTLGAWAMLDDARLRVALSDLGESLPAGLSRARTLFASAIEAPGGLKIQTIHSLCASILRQFPLESGTSPQFAEMDDTAQDGLIAEILDGLAETHPAILAEASACMSAESLSVLAKDVIAGADGFDPPLERDAIAERCGVTPGLTEADILGRAFLDGDLPFLKSLVPILLTGSTRDVELAGRISSCGSRETVRTLLEVSEFLLTGAAAKVPFCAKIGTQPTKALRDGAFLPHLDRFNDLMQRIEEARVEWVPLNAARRMCALHDFARFFLPAYATAKEERGLLDFDDLIRRTQRLLTNPTLPWVLFRLDARLEHILVDEAQDTSPRQWAVIRALAEELTSGTRPDRPRTLFVVGDKKQSIYSFQGADAAGFDRMAEAFGRQLAGGLSLRQMRHSFRSSPAILKAVDATLCLDGVTGTGRDVGHQAFHADMPGRVDVWPLVPPPEKPEVHPWHDPSDRPLPDGAQVTLARSLARFIRRILETEVIADKTGSVRRVAAGDIMILVRSRGEIFDQIISACKSAGLPIAGADRLKIAAELAVRDLTALMSFLALPDDDLALAGALKSPLFGWTEGQLFDLAHGRSAASLWREILRRKLEFPETVTVLQSLRDGVDFLRPYELLERILTRHDGRRKLLGHIGLEAREGIDELLNQALAYERDSVPSLTGFLDHLSASDIVVKRQANGTDDLIRVMTVHGAKGLERPIVILPDTTAPPRPNGRDLLTADDGVSLPLLRRGFETDEVAAARERVRTAEDEERDRLLYVAMTRAEKWLIVCGVGQARAPSRNVDWHRLVREGVTAAGGVEVDTPEGPVLRLFHGEWPVPNGPAIMESVTEKANLPCFLLKAVPGLQSVGPLSPSNLGGAKVLGGGALEEAAAKRRGRQVHLLLEHLSGAQEPQDAAQRLLSVGPDAARPDEVAELFNEAMRNLTMHPALFTAGALAEVDITARLPGIDRQVAGTVDRLLVEERRVLAVDFKTNAVVPGRPEETPEGLLRQMGAYLHALEQVFPGRDVEVAILWTAAATLMPLPHGILRAALGRATIS